MRRLNKVAPNPPMRPQFVKSKLLQAPPGGGGLDPAVEVVCERHSLRPEAPGTPADLRDATQRRLGSHRMMVVLHARLQPTRNCWVGQRAVGVLEPYAEKLVLRVLRGAGDR